MAACIKEEQIIALHNIYKSYKLGSKPLIVLKNINLTVVKGVFLAILGPSVSGKSTLMNLIGCMDRFDTGEYFLSGEPVHRMKEGALTRLRNRKIGFVFQKYQLIPRYTVLQNVALPLLVRGFSRQSAYRYAAAQIAPPWVSPIGALDSQTGIEVLELFKGLNAMGHTIVMITHNEAVAQIARRTVRIIDGELHDA